MTISEQYAAELGRQVDELEEENSRLREALKLAHADLMKAVKHIDAELAVTPALG